MGMTTVHTTIIPQGICHYSFIAQNLQAENSAVVCKIILSVYFKTSSVLFCIALRKKLSLIKYLWKKYILRLATKINLFLYLFWAHSFTLVVKSVIDIKTRGEFRYESIDCLHKCRNWLNKWSITYTTSCHILLSHVRADQHLYQGGTANTGVETGYCSHNVYLS